MENKNYVSWCLDNEISWSEDGDEIIGKEYAKIDLVWVCPEDRKKGIGRKILVEEIEKIKTIHPDMAIKLVVEPKDEDAMDYEQLVSFYESVGFSLDMEVGCDKVFMSL